MTRIITIALALVVHLVVVAGAEPPATPAVDACAESFPARLADAKQALVQFEAFHQDYQKAKPALEWFEAHCRFLEELERVVRKVNDPNAFVCDTQKGRPKELTAELVLNYSTIPNVGAFQADQHHDLNNRCAERDQAARIGLVFGAGSELDQVAHRLLVACYGDARPACVKARETIAAAARAKAAAP